MPNVFVQGFWLEVGWVCDCTSRGGERAVGEEEEEEVEEEEKEEEEKEEEEKGNLRESSSRIWNVVPSSMKKQI